ncbi:MAG: MATE family efflux transporter, partial [Paracoccaceae bacterium]
MKTAFVSPASPQSATDHVRATLALGLPLIGSHVAQFGLHVTDTIMLGWYGVVPLAAGVLGASSFFVMFILGSGFAKAVMPMVANAQAQGDEVQVRRVARMGLWLSILFGVLIYPVFWWSEAILLALGQAEDVAALGQ